MEKLSIKIDAEVLKLKEPRVDQLRTGRLSYKAFSLLIRTVDPFVLVGDTVYAFTEAEYYAINSLYPELDISTEAFNYVLNLEDKSFMSDDDIDTLRLIAEELPDCGSCRFKRFKGLVKNIVKKYAIRFPDTLTATVAVDIPAYPETRSEVKSKLADRFEKLFTIPVSVRQACLDCVEKHVSQAYILAGEVVNGYPEHLSLLCGHLKEAIEELPKEADLLRDTLTFCMARTAWTKEPFIPLQALLKLIEVSRAENKTLKPGQAPERAVSNPYINLDITEDIKNELSICASNSLFIERLEAADEYLHDYEATGSEESRLGWEGTMAAAAECIAQLAPNTAAMLRARRLVFIADPAVAAVGGYTNSGLIKTLK